MKKIGGKISLHCAIFCSDAAAHLHKIRHADPHSLRVSSSITRRNLLVTGFGAGASLAFPSAVGGSRVLKTTPGAAVRPNILFLVTDDQGFGDLAPRDTRR